MEKDDLGQQDAQAQSIPLDNRISPSNPRQIRNKVDSIDTARLSPGVQFSEGSHTPNRDRSGSDHPQLPLSFK